MKFGLVPLNPTIGDLTGNLKKTMDFIDQAVEKKCQIIIFPELSLIGYPPKDLLFYDLIWQKQAKILNELRRKSKHIIIVTGGINKNKLKGPPFQNVSYIFHHGQKHVYAKQLLPNYDVFDEKRYFQAGKKEFCLKLGRNKLGFTICEDIWCDHPRYKNLYDHSPVNAYKTQKINFLINISASPFELGKSDVKSRLLKQTAQKLNSYLIYVNQCGANDDLIFDGGSFVYAPNGDCLFASPLFEEKLFIFDSEDITEMEKQKLNPMEELRQALVIGIRDYVRKSGFRHVLLGLSGGIDSALVVQLAVEALGADHVTAVLLPSRYSSKGSLTDAYKLAKNLNINTMEVSINDLHKTYEKTFRKIWGKNKTLDLTAQNVQARIRGNLLMAISNNTGALLLNTTNKSEMAMGYGTLYGDMCGALAVISDLTKENVYLLAHHMNPNFECIPREVFEKEPSAELKPDQKDSDSLPLYENLDPLLLRWVEEEQFTEDDWQDHPILAKTFFNNEYKRFQAPLGLKVTSRAFGPGRRYPIVKKPS